MANSHESFATELFVHFVLHLFLIYATLPNHLGTTLVYGELILSRGGHLVASLRGGTRECCDPQRNDVGRNQELRYSTIEHKSRQLTLPSLIDLRMPE